MITFEMTVGIKDCKIKYRYMLFHSRFYKIYMAIVIGLGLVYYFAFGTQGPYIEDYVGDFMILSVLVIGILAIPEGFCTAIPKFYKKDFPITAQYTLEEDGFRIKTPGMETFIKWSEVASIKEVDKYILFHGHKTHWFTIYKELVSKEDLKAIKTFLTDSDLPVEKALL